MDLDKIKGKTTDELAPEEKTFLIENRDKLNDEDLAAYGDFINPQDDVIAPLNPGSGDSGDGDADAGAGGKGGDDGTTVTPPPAYTFKTEEEARAFVDKQIADRETARKAQDDIDKQTAIDAVKTPEQKKYVDENWKPKDWNEGLDKAADVAIAKIEQRQAEAAAKVKTNSDRLEKEWQDVASTNKLPSLDTKEGREVHNQIVQVALAHGKTSFKDAYDLWAIIPSDKGGGYQIPASEAGAALAKQKEQMKAQKQAAGEVGGKTPDGKGSGLQRSAKDLRSKSLDQLLDERMSM